MMCTTSLSDIDYVGLVCGITYMINNDNLLLTIAHDHDYLLKINNISNEGVVN